MEFKTVELEILEEGKMALVQFNRPDVLNTFNTQLAEDLNKAIDQIKKEGKIRAMNTPWIAAINGPCFGVGLSLACCCDFRVTSAKAKLSVAFTGVGLSPDSSLLYYLPRILGLTKATEMPTLALGLDKKCWMSATVIRLKSTWIWKWNGLVKLLAPGILRKVAEPFVHPSCHSCPKTVFVSRQGDGMFTPACGVARRQEAANNPWLKTQGARSKGRNPSINGALP